MTVFFNLTDLGLSSSPAQLLQTWLTAMQAQYPGYQPSPASLEYVQAQILASMAADLADLAGQGSTELFRTFGTTLAGVPYQTGTSAQAVINIAAQAAPATIATLSGTLATGGGAITALPVVALPYGIAAGTVTLSDGIGHTQAWTTSGALAGTTSLPVSSLVPNFNYPANTSTLSGTQAYLLPAGSQFGLDQLGFQTLGDVTINSGTSQQVTLTAIQAGVVFNGAGAGGSIVAVQQQGWISTTTLVAAASGGADPEDDAHYLIRLVTALQLQAPRPITASDYGLMSLDFQPAPGTGQQLIGRSTAVDGYNPADGTFNNQRMVCVAVTDTNGFALNNLTMYGYPNGTSVSPILTTPSPSSGWGVEGWLLAKREINFIVNVIAPTYSAVYVAVTVKGGAGWDAPSIQTNIQQALLNFLAPAGWGLPPSNALGWQNTTFVFLSAVAAVIHQTGVIDHIIPGTLALGLTPGPTNVTNDLALAGPVALPISSVSTIPLSAITVT